MEGEIYTEVDASVLNPGISTMAMVSGNPTPVDGQAYVVVWIRWMYDDTTGQGGFTNTGWYFDDTNNVLPQKFESEDAFKQWLVDNKPSALDDQLQDWNASNKAAFLNTRLSALEDGGCLYFTANI